VKTLPSFQTKNLHGKDFLETLKSQNALPRIPVFQVYLIAIKIEKL